VAVYFVSVYEGIAIEPDQVDDDEQQQISSTLAVYEGANLSERLHDVLSSQNGGKAANASAATIAVPHLRTHWFVTQVRAAKRAILTLTWNSEIAECWEREELMNHLINREMLTTTRVVGLTPVHETVVAEVHRINKDVVSHIPRLVVEVVVALRCKLGVGAQDRRVPGNVSVVRAEAAKMMRDWNVRNKDAAAHLLEIEKCFFEDETHYRVTTWRARVARKSRFLRWFIGTNEPVGFDY